MTEKRILYKARKKKPTVDEIKELVKKGNVIIYGAPLSFAKQLIVSFPEYAWVIYDSNADEVPMPLKMFMDYHDFFVQGLSNVYKIFFERKKKFRNIAYIVFRKVKPYYDY